jgi:predicted O-methyltransferase YrrM
VKQKLIFDLKFLKYKIFAKHAHGRGIHSPFLFGLISDVLSDSTPYYSWENIETVRKKMIQSTEIIDVLDLGAGSTKMESKIRKISDIAKFSAVDKKNGKLLFKLVNYFRPKTIIELGTSLGIGTLYLASPDSRNRVFTVEGCPETAKKARENFESLKFQNIILKTGSFDEILPLILHEIKKLDFVYFDGNHRKKPTLTYFDDCLSKSHNETVFVFDDIHWSEEMEEAWETIKNNPKVTLSVDLFQKGLIFFKTELSKQDFVIRF